jgi:hypothetical protein
MPNKERIKEAVENYGKEVVLDVLMTVSMSDPDGAYAMFEDMGQGLHSECVETLFFDLQD